MQCFTHLAGSQGLDVLGTGGTVVLSEDHTVGGPAQKRTEAVGISEITTLPENCFYLVLFYPRYTAMPSKQGFSSSNMTLRLNWSFQSSKPA